jgi:uncharacterized protein (DUF302 family)
VDDTDGTDDVVEHVSAMDFTTTLARLKAAIEGAGMTVFAAIDHAAGAASVGLAMPPTTVLLYGNPKGGTPLMLAAPQVALDLPLRVLVREDADGTTRVSFHPVVLLEKAGVPAELAARLEPAQRLLVAAIDG